MISLLKNRDLLLFVLFPVFRIHGAGADHFFRELFVSFSEKISGVFGDTLQKQSGDQPYVACFQKICHAFFYQPDALTFRRHSFKNLRMLRLGNSQIKIPVELLHTGVIVRMIYTRF